MLLDPRNGPRWDLHTTEQNRRSYVVASTPRTGSTLLCRTLWGTGLVGAPKEYLNPMQLRDWEVRLGSPWSSLRHRALAGMSLGLVTRGRWDHQRIAEHLDRVKQRRTASSGWFGMKLHAHHHRQWFAARPIEEFLGPVRWIRIRREDRLAQAISWERAMQSGQWASHQASSTAQPSYVRGAITARLAAIERDEAWWDTVLRHEPVLELTYERLARQRTRVTREVLHWLGVEGAHSVGLGPAGMQSQSDATSRQWRRDYQRGE